MLSESQWLAQRGVLVSGNTAPTMKVETEAAASGRSTRTLMVRAITYLARDILSFELVSPERAPLPAFSAGAHLDVHVPGGYIRQYSLCNDPTERHRYVIAVLRETHGRGGSEAMHQAVQAGSELVVSEPRNRFPLAANADRHILVAGGIGITPMMAMVAALRNENRDFELHYLTRSPERTAFREDLAALVETGQARIYHDDGDPSRQIDLAALIGPHEAGTHVYYCGPPGFMTAMETATERWPASAVHFERFNAPPDGAPAADEVAQGPFEIVLARTGETFTVEPGQSIVQVLRANGIEVDTSCEEGYCGTCMTRYLSGEPLHRDSVLDDEDRQQFVMICCAGCNSDRLELDL